MPRHSLRGSLRFIQLIEFKQFAVTDNAPALPCPILLSAKVAKYQP
jgi:hypothetical protein